ncbi:Uncharacterised protein [Vibrio cholerae]|nr:Uncharacterised protein [Vibrio cholerae]
MLSQLRYQVGASAAVTPCMSGPLMVSIMLTRAKAATAGAVVYKNAINTNAQPAETRASDTLGTVKKRIIT